MDFHDILRQIERLDSLPMTQEFRNNATCAFQLVIDGLASQLFGAAHERDRAASLEATQER